MAGVTVEDLVHAQLAHFARSRSFPHRMHDAKIRLNAASAQTIGLALHELGTNAGKYGALSIDRGHADIRWGIDGDTADRWATRRVSGEAEPNFGRLS